MVLSSCSGSHLWRTRKQIQRACRPHTGPGIRGRAFSALRSAHVGGVRIGITRRMGEYDQTYEKSIQRNGITALQNARIVRSSAYFRLKYSVGPDPLISCAHVKSALLRASRANDLPFAGNGMCFCAVQRNPLLERYSFFFQPGSRRARLFRGFQFGFPIIHQFCRAYSPRAFQMGQRLPLPAMGDSLLPALCQRSGVPPWSSRSVPPAVRPVFPVLRFHLPALPASAGSAFRARLHAPGLRLFPETPPMSSCPAKQPAFPTFRCRRAGGTSLPQQLPCLTPLRRSGGVSVSRRTPSFLPTRFRCASPALEFAAGFTLPRSLPAPASGFCPACRSGLTGEPPLRGILSASPVFPDCVAPRLSRCFHDSSRV